MDSLLSRIEEVRKDKKMSMRQFDSECQLPQGTISFALKRMGQYEQGDLDKIPSLNTTSVEKILRKFPEYSADWLILERGPKFYQELILTEDKADGKLKKMLNETTSQLNEQRKLNADLTSMIAQFRIRCIEHNIDISDLE